MSEIDVLIITALKEELDAARDVARASAESGLGVATWEERDVQSATPYFFGKYVTPSSHFNIALARPTRMGALSTSPIAASLARLLSPRCLAMCGVCAGNPGDVALGDVIIAEMVYAYDEGKRSQHAFDGDHRHFLLPDAWLRAAQDMDPDDLPSYGPASIDESKNWVLDRLHAEDDPTRHSARVRYFPQGTWSERIRALENDGLVRRDGQTLVLTDQGRAAIDERLFFDLDGPRKLPFSIKVGPIASGNVVVKDGVTWESLKQWGVRSVLGIEMEGAMIGSIAHRLSVPTWIVAKGVMDHADPRKSDRYKNFAARASAEVLFKFLARQFGEKNGIDIRSAQGRLPELCVGQLEVRELVPQEDDVAGLSPYGFRLSDPDNDKSTQEKILALRRRFLERREGLFINKTFLPIATDNPILDDYHCPIVKRALLVGNAGVGKSSILAFYVKQLQNADIPVIPFSFDELPDGILTPEQLGRELGLPMSPVRLLANLAKGKTSVLVIDQLDAISLSSGKRTDLWNLFEMLCDEIGTGEEAIGTPGVHLLVGCREFDLENDHRLRRLKQSDSRFTIARLKLLSREQVDGALRNAGIDQAAIPSATGELLHLPIHLSMFIGLSSECRPGAVTREGLFDAFWQDKEKRLQQHIGYPPRWTQVIDALCGWCSRRQELSAPDYVLDEFSADARAMVSEHILLHAQRRYRFFHDSFFDYAFARRFAARGDRLLDVLLRGEQHLFRRAQVRAVLAFLRQRDRNAYLAELESLLLGSIRFHLKRSVLVDLYNLADPTLAEWKILLKFAVNEPDLRHHAVAAAATSAAWFDIAEQAHFFDEGLASGNEQRAIEIINLIRTPIVLQARSPRVAAILKRHRMPGERWNAYLASICRMGELHHDRDIFEIFLSLIDDGTLDAQHPTGERDWLGQLWKVKDANPAYACEAVGHWFDRRVKMHDPSADANVYGDWFAGTATERYWIQEISSKAPEPYVEWMLPRVAQLVNATVDVDSGDLGRDPVWKFRHYGDDGHTIAEGILGGLAKSMELLATTNPDMLDRAAVS